MQSTHPAGPDGAPRAVDDALFRSLMGSFPSGVTVVTTLDEAGAPRGMSVSAFMSVSASPPMLAVCLGRRSQTLAAIRSAGFFAAHVLAEDSADLARHFGRPGSGFTVPWRPSPRAGGVPVLRGGAVAVAECRVASLVPAGDHELVLGAIVGGWLAAGRPLVYHRSRFTGWVDEQAFPDIATLAGDPLGC